jgi:hypothetical protein
MSCSDTSIQQLYLVGASASISLYTCIVSASSQSNYPNQRNLHLLLSGICTLTCCIVGIVLAILNAAPQEDPIGLNLARGANSFGNATYGGLNTIPLFLGVLFATLAALHRYTSYLKDRARVIVFTLVSSTSILFFLSSIALSLYDILTPTLTISDDSCIPSQNGILTCSFATYYPVGASMSDTLKSITIVVSLFHIIFGLQMLYSKFTSPAPVYSTTAHKMEAVAIGSLSGAVVMIWFIYLIVANVQKSDLFGVSYSLSLYANQGVDSITGLDRNGNKFTPGLISGGLIGPIYLLCHSFALLCESSILPRTLNLNGEEEEEEEEEAHKDNIFLTT